MRFIVTAEGENLTALANRLFRTEGREALAAARRRLLELNPGLPERKNVPAGTIVVVPADADGKAASQGQSFGDVTKGVLTQLREVVGRLDETLAREVEEEYGRQSQEEAYLADPQLRAPARSELAEHLNRIAKAFELRRRQTKQVQELAKTATREMEEDLADLAELAGYMLPDRKT